MGRTGARGGTDGSLKIQRTAQNRGGCVVTFLGLVRSDVFQVGS
jgi:molybdopterin synthase catalytic subunit